MTACETSLKNEEEIQKLKKQIDRLEKMFRRDQADTWQVIKELINITSTETVPACGIPGMQESTFSSLQARKEKEGSPPAFLTNPQKIVLLAPGLQTMFELLEEKGFVQLEYKGDF